MRWLTRDPILYDGGTNLYEYVGGRPTRFVDPSGLDSQDSVTKSLEKAIARGDINEIETILDVTGKGLRRDIRTAAEKALARLQSTGDEILSRECAGQVRRRFPGQFLDKTLKEIQDLARLGDRDAQTALKLLNKGDFKK